MTRATTTRKKTAGKKTAGKKTATSRPTRVEGVLIVGGGYAGVHAARAARNAGCRATIVDPAGRHDFVTRLAAVAGGTAPRGDASSPLERFTDDVIIAEMTGVADGVVELGDGRRLRADGVVITAGAVPVSPPIPGLDRARPLRTAEDALALREVIREADAVVIIGGGATGVQLAGAISARRRSVRVTLVDAEERLVAAMGEAIAADAERILRQRRVDVRTGVEVESISSSGVVLADGEEIDGLVVWAAGYTARASSFGVPTAGSGRIGVDRFLRVEGWERTFAAGDVADHVDRDGSTLAMSAQIAVQAGEVAGANAARLVLDGDDARLREAHLEHRGWVLDLSGHRGLAEFGPVALSAPFLDVIPPLLHWGIDLKHLVETRGLGAVSDLPGL